jgi:uncharacterized protein YegP (UPF0339 family)
MTPARFQFFRVSDGCVEWRFMASNNRVIANGGEGTEDVSVARATLADLQADIGEATPAAYRDAVGRWRWDVRHGGTVLAASSRWYHRRVDCASTLAQFLNDAPGATIVDGVMAFRSVSDLSACRVEPPTPAPRSVSGRNRFGGRGGAAH